MEICRVEAAVCWNTLRAFTTHYQIGGSENVEGLGNQQATRTREALRDYTPPTVTSRVDGEEIVQTTTQPRMVVASER